MSVVTRLWAGRFGVWIPAGTRDFFLSTKMSRPALGPTHHFVELGFPGVKAAGAWSYRSRPFRVKLKNEWRYSSTRPVCLLGVDRSSFTCYLVAYLFSFIANCREEFLHVKYPRAWADAFIIHETQLNHTVLRLSRGYCDQATDWTAEESGLDSRRGKRVFSSPKRPGLLW